MRRWLFRVMMVLSILLGLASAALWIRSEFRCDVVFVNVETHSSLWQIGSANGTLQVLVDECPSVMGEVS